MGAQLSRAPCYNCCKSYCKTDTSLGHPHRGVSSAHLSGPLVEQVRLLQSKGLLGPDEVTVSDIEPLIIRPKGENVVCPRDHRLGAAYVDSISEANVSTFMLSYTWMYLVTDIADTLAKFCTDHGLDPSITFFWICCLCVNQHRVKENRSAGVTIPFEVFRKEFADKVEHLDMICMMSPWQEPYYLKRVWCIFEMYTACSFGKEVSIVMPPETEKDFLENLQNGNDRFIKALAHISTERAEASISHDRHQIFSLIQSDEGPGFARLDQTVARRLKSWAADISERHVLERIASGDLPDVQLGKMCNRIATLMKQCGRTQDSAPLRAEAIRAFERAGALCTDDGFDMVYVDIIRALHMTDEKGMTANVERMHAVQDYHGINASNSIKFKLAMSSYFVAMFYRDWEAAFNALSDALNLAEDAEDLNLKSVMPVIQSHLGPTRILATRDVPGSLADIQKTLKMIDGLDESLSMQEHAMVLAMFALAKLSCGQVAEALADANQSCDFYEKLGGLEFSTHGNLALMLRGFLLFKQGEESLAQLSFDQGVRISAEQGMLEFNMIVLFPHFDGPEDKDILMTLMERGSTPIKSSRRVQYLLGGQTRRPKFSL